MGHLKFGTGYKRAWLMTLPGRNSPFPSPDEVFPELSGFNEQIQLHSVGVFFDAEGFRGEYDLGGRAYLEAAYQDQLGGSLRYFTYDIELEGRAPLAPKRSALIGQAHIQLNRERGQSDPLPFFLNGRVGGSSTLRGFALDRYSGRNLLFATIEYRFALTPNLQAFIFLDEGQIFDHTSELGFTNWHRNYGLGIKFKSVKATVLGLEVGYGEEGVNFHITFGDRVSAPLGGPIRYGRYRR
jgi:hemolysin activation/secretion protein